jgi:hypothetical protein
MFSTVPTTAGATCRRDAAPAPGRQRRGRQSMNLQITLAPILALLAGILILVRPKLLNFIVAIYLIIIGILGLTGGRF